MLNKLVEFSLQYKFLVLIIFAVVGFLGLRAVSTHWRCHSRVSRICPLPSLLGALSFLHPYVFSYGMNPIFSPQSSHTTSLLFSPVPFHIAFPLCSPSC